jgi:hypothetical protein
MKSLSQPRVVLVRRKTAWEHLLERHATTGQAVFYLQSRGQDPGDVQRAHEAEHAAFAEVLQQLDSETRRVILERGDLDRFLFDPADRVLVVGQDGLVANVAKYLQGQPVAGINPLPQRYDGVLCPHSVRATAQVLAWFNDPAQTGFKLQGRTMVRARREDGQELLGLNELFVGHRSHQSARYRLSVGEQQERQSSSGFLLATGTGATGWALSIARQRDLVGLLPRPSEARAAWFSREPFPSRYTKTDLDSGSVTPGQSLELVSEMDDQGAVFADGMEDDRLEFVFGQRLTLDLAPKTLNLVVPLKQP